MKKPDYTAFDALLLEQIAAGRNAMMALDTDASGLRPASEPFKVRDRHGYLTDSFRIIDRRLQALRKAGRIRFNGKTWEVLEASA